MSVEEFLNQHPVFTFSQFLNNLLEEKDISYKSMKNLLVKLKNQGDIGRIRRELYHAVAPDEALENNLADLCLAASLMAEDCILAYTTALEKYLGFDTPSIKRIFFFTKGKVRATTFKSVRFSPCTFPMQLLEMEQEEWGISKYNYYDSIKMTGIERTLVDILNNLKFCGGWQTVLPLLNQIDDLDIYSILEYLEKLDSRTTYARVGWYLDSHSDKFHRFETNKEHFQAYLPKQMCHLIPGERNGILIKDWNLIAPKQLAK